jgi:hypothetical protein
VSGEGSGRKTQTWRDRFIFSLFAAVLYEKVAILKDDAFIVFFYDDIFIRVLK